MSQCSKRMFPVAGKEVNEVPAELVTKSERTHRRGVPLGDSRVRIALLAAFAILAEVVLARKVLDVDLNFVAQLAPMWVFVAFKLSGRRDRPTEIAAAVAVVVATAVVLTVYAL